VFDFALRYVYTYEGEDNNLLGNVFIYKELVKVMRMIEELGNFDKIRRYFST
jgi:hypothetical protein